MCVFPRVLSTIVPLLVAICCHLASLCLPFYPWQAWHLATSSLRLSEVLSLLPLGLSQLVSPVSICCVLAFPEALPPLFPILFPFVACVSLCAPSRGLVFLSSFCLWNVFPLASLVSQLVFLLVSLRMVRPSPPLSRIVSLLVVFVGWRSFCFVPRLCLLCFPACRPACLSFCFPLWRVVSFCTLSMLWKY